MKQRLVAALFVGVLLHVSPSVAQPPAQQYPILFLHGLCSSSNTWSTMTTLLAASNPGRYGVTVTRLFSDSVDVWVREETMVRKAREVFPTPNPALRMFAIDFRGLIGTLEPSDVAQVPIVNKAIEVKQVIDEIKRITAQSKVIVIGHSYGGLVGRAYVQHGAPPYRGYDHDVVALVTIDSPHLGTPLAALDPRAVDPFVECLIRPSVNKREMIPNSDILRALNALPWPVDTPAASIASWQTEFPDDKSDFVVSYASQNLLSVYPQLANTLIFLVDSPISLGPSRQILHLLVNQHPATIALIHIIVAAADRLPLFPPAVISLAGRGGAVPR